MVLYLKQELRWALEYCWKQWYFIWHL